MNRGLVMKRMLQGGGLLLQGGALLGAAGLLIAAARGKALLVPLIAKYGELEPHEWSSNFEARAIFHGPGPLGVDSWTMYFWPLLAVLLVVTCVAGLVPLGLATGWRGWVLGGVMLAVTLSLLMTGHLGFGESIGTIAVVVE